MSKITEATLVPHMVIAGYNWILEGGGRPHFTFAADYLTDPTLVSMSRQADPEDPKSSKVLILNMSMNACPNLRFENGVILGSMTFGGIHTSICIPMNLVLTVYDVDTGMGVPVNSLEAVAEWVANGSDLPESANEAKAAEPTIEPEAPAKPKRPNHLKLVH